MCLLVHGQLLNNTCNDLMFKALAMSLFGKTMLKGKQCTLKNLENVVSKLKEKIKLQPAESAYSKPSCINTITLVKVLCHTSLSVNFVICKNKFFTFCQNIGYC